MAARETESLSKLAAIFFLFFFNNNDNSLFSQKLQIGAHVTYKEIICKHKTPEETRDAKCLELLSAILNDITYLSTNSLKLLITEWTSKKTYQT